MRSIYHGQDAVRSGRPPQDTAVPVVLKGGLRAAPRVVTLVSLAASAIPKGGSCPQPGQRSKLGKKASLGGRRRARRLHLFRKAPGSLWSKPRTMCCCG